MGDAEEPTREPARRVEGREAAERLDEGLLGEVLGKRPVARHPRDEADDRALIPAHDLLEGRLGAGQGLGDDPGLAYGFQIDRDGAVLSVKLTQRGGAALQASRQGGHAA